MTLSNYIPDLIEEDFEELVTNALRKSGLAQDQIDYWCIHPGGKRILEAVHKSLHFDNGHLDESFDILKHFGNMSSPTILFVLEKILNRIHHDKKSRIFGAAFGPGLTMETFIAST